MIWALGCGLWAMGFGAWHRAHSPQPIAAVPIAPGGFEPPFCGPKPHVLPLDEGADALAE